MFVVVCFIFVVFLHLITVHREYVFLPLTQRTYTKYNYTFDLQKELASFPPIKALVEHVLWSKAQNNLFKTEKQNTGNHFQFEKQNKQMKPLLKALEWRGNKLDSKRSSNSCKWALFIEKYPGWELSPMQSKSHGVQLFNDFNADK